MRDRRGASPRSLFSALAALLLFAFSCRSTGAGAPFAPVASSAAGAVWSELQSRAASFEGARSYMKLRMTDRGRTRTFNARFFASRDGKVLLEAVTPVGTTAFTLYLDGDAAMWIDEIHATYWEGSIAGVAPLSRFIGSGLDSRSFAMIVLGLPFSADALAGDAQSRSAGVAYATGPSGLASVTLESSGITSRIDYAPAAFPPSKVSFSTSAAPDTSLQLEHLELASGAQKVSRPEVPRDYVRATPAL